MAADCHTGRGDLPSGYPNLPLSLIDAENTLLIDSDAGIATPGNEAFDWQPNYVVMDGNQALPDELYVRVEADNNPTTDQNDKRYNLEVDTAAASPSLVPDAPGVAIPIQLLRELIDGQELDLPADTTVEIRIPYNELGDTQLTPSTARAYDIQLFPPGSNTPYGSRTIGGAPLVAGPDAFEIELSINAAQAGTWLLVTNYNRGRRDITNLTANVTLCSNTDDVVRYPLDGECVELRRPPAVLTIGSTYQEVGNLRIYSPGGFTGTCPSSCTTNSEDPAMIPVMPMVGFQGDDDHWVALKGGTFTLSNAGVTTSADTRLVMADFSDPDEIVSMPVLRGDFEAAATGSILETTSAPADTYLLVKQPMNETLDTGFTYTIDLGIADDRLRGQGTIQRIIRPTADKPATTFTFDAEWSMQVQGGSTLQGR
ncbi:MAG: hypothetical protein HC893_04325 [Chloroflexaceae bacterium]|nr:hypothetical protein [Chloroflexaceae bacterium]